MVFPRKIINSCVVQPFCIRFFENLLLTVLKNRSTLSFRINLIFLFSYPARSSSDYFVSAIRFVDDVLIVTRCCLQQVLDFAREL